MTAGHSWNTVDTGGGVPGVPPRVDLNAVFVLRPLLATVLQLWNLANFRYAATDLDIDDLKNVLSSEPRSDFAALTEYDLQTIDGW